MRETASLAGAHDRTNAGKVGLPERPQQSRFSGNFEDAARQHRLPYHVQQSGCITTWTGKGAAPGWGTSPTPLPVGLARHASPRSTIHRNGKAAPGSGGGRLGATLHTGLERWGNAKPAGGTPNPMNRAYAARVNAMSVGSGAGLGMLLDCVGAAPLGCWPAQQHQQTSGSVGIVCCQASQTALPNPAPK